MTLPLTHQLRIMAAIEADLGRIAPETHSRYAVRALQPGFNDLSVDPTTLDWSRPDGVPRVLYGAFDEGDEYEYLTARRVRCRFRFSVYGHLRLPPSLLDSAYSSATLLRRDLNAAIQGFVSMFASDPHLETGDGVARGQTGEKLCYLFRIQGTERAYGRDGAEFSSSVSCVYEYDEAATS
jgi:hypothetical protein